MASEIMLELNGINVYYGKMRALWNISLNVKEGEMVALIGPNGAGKTTLLNTIIGAVQHSSGLIKFQGKRIDNLETYKRIKLGISLVPEGRLLFPELTVIENLIMGSYVKRGDKNRMLNLVFSLFPILEKRKNQIASTLSGGEQQMLAIGRALMSNPRLLLIDEISLGLAPKVVDILYKVIRELNSSGTTILFVDQDAGRAIEEAERAYILEAGRIVLENSTNNLSKDLILKKYFGTEEF